MFFRQIFNEIENIGKLLIRVYIFQCQKHYNFIIFVRQTDLCKNSILLFLQHLYKKTKASPMIKNILGLTILVLLCGTNAFSQKKSDILLTIDDNPIYQQEFIRVYKKNLDLVQDESQKDIDSYLELFIDYKLKVVEAQAQKLDQDDIYKTEFSQYRDQLSRNYLFEDKVMEEMAREAYKRGKEEIDASHILLMVDYGASPKDTLAVYNRMKDILDKAKKGEDFTKLAQTYSEEPGAKQRGGALGYFTVFSMVYPFETEAYNTKKGEVSDIVRSSFGYHIIKVNDRRAKLSNIGVSHIMISDKKDVKNFNAEERANEIKALLKQGESFESLAKQFSDDKNSGLKGGKLKPFGRGDLRAPDFEKAAYALKNIGDISEPIKTDFGWHIIRLDEKLAPETYEQQKDFLEKKVSQGDRSKVVTHSINKKIQNKYGFTQDSNYLDFFNTYVGDDILARKWTKTEIPAAQNKVLFTIGDKNVHYSDFAKYIAKRQTNMKAYKEKSTLLVEFYEEFESIQLKEHFKDRLEVENSEYAAILSEYRDGLLIFEVMNQNIWEKSKTDTIGLQSFYNRTKDDYQWKQRVDADIYSATSLESAKKVQTLLNEGKSSDEVKTALNTKEMVNIILTEGVYETDQDELPKELEIMKGVSKIIPNNDSFVVVNIKDVIAPGVKSLDDIRGRVTSNYQNQLETEWISELRSKFDVEVNKKTLKKLKKQLK